MSYLLRQPWRDAQLWHQTGVWRDDTLPDMLTGHADRNPDGVAVVDGEARVTWRELRAASGRFAARLAEGDVTDGDVVVICLPDGAEFIAVSAAAHAVQAVAAPLAHASGESEVLTVVERTRAKAVFSHRELKVPAGVDLIPVSRTDVAFWTGSDAPLPPHGRSTDADAVSDIMFTSGTTGRPKGVMNTSNTKLTGLRGVLSEFDFSADDVWGVVAPLSHNAGWLYTALPALATRARSVVVDRGDPERMLDTLAREQVTATFLVPTHLADLLHAYRQQPNRWSLALRYVFTGAASAAEDAIRDVAAVWGAVPISIYGMTECQANLFTRADDPIQVVATTVGRPCPGAEVALRDPGTGELVEAEGEVGEVVTRGATTFVGYYDDQAATADTFTKDGWLRSGDLAVVQDGSYRIVGRLKEVILRGGGTIVPKDVEAAVATYPGIGEAAVIGLPDERLGERVCACVLGPEVPTVEQVREHLSASGYGRRLWPDEVRQVAGFPRTEVGKVQRTKLRQHVVSLTPTG